jgi:hypothetical protein
MPCGVSNQETGDLRGCHPAREHARSRHRARCATGDGARPRRPAPEAPGDATAVPGDWAITGGLTDAAPD